MYIAQRQGQTNPWGQAFDVNRKALSLCPFVASFQNISLILSLILYTHLMILYMYIAPRQGKTTSWGQNYDVNRKALSFCPFVASFKNISLNMLKSDFIHFFHAFIHVYNALSLCPFVASFKKKKNL